MIETIGDATLYTGCCLDVLADLPEQSVNTCVTSPPYFGLRDYGTAVWLGGDLKCDHKVRKDPKVESSTLGGGKKTTGHQQEGYKGHCRRCGAVRTDGQIGLEPTPDDYVARMVEVFRAVRRVLRDDGTVWLNLGDSYTSGGRKTRDPADISRYGVRNKSSGLTRAGTPAGLKPKDLIGIPWRVAFALQADGWYLRQEIIWHKPNPMPESVTDRCTKAHEYIFMLTKSARYFYDQEAIKTPGASADYKTPDGWDTSTGDGGHGSFHKNGREKGRKTDKQRGHGRRHAGFNDRWDSMSREEQTNRMVNKRSVWEVATKPYPGAHFATFPPDLIEPCVMAGCPAGGVVIDPFSGSGTTGQVALQQGRKYIGIELNPEYQKLAVERITPYAAQGRLFE